MTDADLLLEFSNLGNNTEFGFIQRCCGLEPISLLRFVPSNIRNLCHALETRFEHLYGPDDLRLLDSDDAGLFFVESRYYDDFRYWTFGEGSADERRALLKKEVARTAFLRRRMLEDLAEGDKIFVRKGGEGLADIRRLHRAVVACGARALLVVAVADRDHRTGTVERLGDGLFRGYISEFKVCSRSEPFDVSGWLQVCRRTWRLAKPGRPLADNIGLTGGREWVRAPVAEAVRGADVDGGIVFATPKRPASGLAPRDTLLFSARIRVPPWFGGTKVHAGFIGSRTLHAHPYDLRRRGTWQRVWATTIVPRGTDTLVGAIASTGGHEGAVELGTWAFALGVAPTGAEPAERRSLAAIVGDAHRRARLRRLRTHHARLVAGSPSRDAALAWAEILVAEGAFVEADDVLADALAACPDDPALLKAYALSAHNQGRYGSAVERWAKAVSVDPSDPMCFAGFACNLREHGVAPRAQDVIASGLARFPDSMVILTEAARIAEMARQPREALAHWEKAIALHGEHPAWLLGRDRALDAVDRLEGRALAGT